MRQIKITQSITNRETQTVEFYLNEINKIQLIEPDEEAILASKIKQGDRDALEKLTKANLRFVVSIAKRYQHMGLPFSDLISEGNLGLLRAAEKFDETKGFKFISFAVWWIRQSILEAIAQQPRMIRLPMNQVGVIIKINRAIGELEQQVQRMPTSDELGGFLGINDQQIKSALNHTARTLSFDTPTMNSEDPCTLLEIIPSNDLLSDHIVNEQDSATELNLLLSHLTERERQIIELSFGLTGDIVMSPADISPKVGLTAERVRQIRNFAIKKLRQNSNLNERN